MVDAHGIDAHGSQTPAELLRRFMVRKGIAEREVDAEEADAAVLAVDKVSLLIDAHPPMLSGRGRRQRRDIRCAAVRLVAAHRKRHQDGCGQLLFFFHRQIQRQIKRIGRKGGYHREQQTAGGRRFHPKKSSWSLIRAAQPCGLGPE